MLKHAKVIKKMALEEKVSLLSGANFWNTKAISRLHIPAMMLTDGPHGLRKQAGKADHLGLNESIPATCFPTASALACSWDESLLYRVGAAIGAEAAKENVGVLLGPGLNNVRNPLGGRSFEYYSEDPFISGRLAACFVRGVQSLGIAACPKHFAVNSQEHLRMSIDEIVDERALHEIYLEGFRRVVKESSPKALMSSYNKVNGTYANENPYLLKETLYQKWGFDGVVVTDWGGNHNRVAGLLAGNQLEMPSTNGITDREVLAAVKKGIVTEEVLDKSIDAILELTLSTHEATKKRREVDYDRHHDVAVEAAQKSIVLLKNDNVLPLTSETTVAIIGDFAKIARYQGAGSSLVHPTRLTNAYDALRQAHTAIVGYEKGFHRFGKKSRLLQEKARRLAKKADVTILFLGLDEASEAEGIDRTTLQLPENQQALLYRLIDDQRKVIVVLSGGSPVELPFADDVSAIVHGFLGGQGGGQAIADVLTGVVNPSGKLSVTYPLVYDDVPSSLYYPGQELTAEHRESIFVGYRYYETAQVPVRFAFGHGLSYTKFLYSNLRVTKSDVCFTIKNIGEVTGAEIAQLYIAAHGQPIFRPRKELKGFAKVFLEPGESKNVTIAFDEHTFAYYNAEVHDWQEPAGDYTIEISSSINDPQLAKLVHRNGKGKFVRYDKKRLKAYDEGDIQYVSSRTFALLMGRRLPRARWDRSQKVTIDDTIAQLQYTNLFGKLCYGFLKGVRRILFWVGRPIMANNVMFIINMPFNKLEGYSGGKISRTKIQRFLKRVNRA
ncbi:MAG: glycoside hydrolase family 3 C-terminal domain-containing protein [Candidatus Saccharimonas sp.]